MGSRCSRASPVSEPTAMLMQNWMHSWKTLVQAVHSRITMPNMAANVITTLARVAYRYPAKSTKANRNTGDEPERDGCCCRGSAAVSQSLTLRPRESVRAAGFCDALCTGAAQDLLEQCGAESGQAGATQALGGRGVVR